MKDNQAYYAVIPSIILSDPRLKAGAKILYGFISSLTNSRGYCFASNAYLAELSGASKRTLQEWIGSLENCGYIRRDVVRDDGNEVTERRIYLSDSNRAGPHASDCTRSCENPHDPSCENPHEVMRKSAPIILKLNNKAIDNIPPYIPPRGECAPFDIFWGAYPKKTGQEKARAAFRRLDVNDEDLKTMLDAIARQKRTKRWRSGKIPQASTWLNGKRWQDDTASMDIGISSGGEADNVGNFNQRQYDPGHFAGRMISRKNANLTEEVKTKGEAYENESS